MAAPNKNGDDLPQGAKNLIRQGLISEAILKFKKFRLQILQSRHENFETPPGPGREGLASDSFAYPTPRRTQSTPRKKAAKKAAKKK